MLTRLLKNLINIELCILLNVQTLNPYQKINNLHLI
jgi:hypothetical protein